MYSVLIFINLFVYLFIHYRFICLFVHLFIHSFIIYCYLLIDSFIIYRHFHSCMPAIHLDRSMACMLLTEWCRPKTHRNMSSLQFGLNRILDHVCYCHPWVVLSLSAAIFWFKGCRMGRSDKVSLWYVALLINTKFLFFILESAIVKRI